MAASLIDPLCRAFFDAQQLDGHPSSELATALEAAIAAGNAAWPKVVIDHAAFAGFLGHRVPGDVSAVETLQKLAITDLYLVCACLANDPHARKELEDAFLKPLPSLLARQNIELDLASEVTQELRVRLLTGPKPLLLSYGGTGALRSWLRITAMRSAIRAQRKHRGQPDVPAALADAATDPELQYQRRLYQQEFREAFADALAVLPTRQRNLLKHSVLHGATSDDLGTLYQVSRATAARWLAEARDQLAAETRRRMIDKLGLDRAEYESILRLIHSQLDVSIARLLESREA